MNINNNSFILTNSTLLFVLFDKITSLVKWLNKSVIEVSLISYELVIFSHFAKEFTYVRGENAHLAHIIL